MRVRDSVDHQRVSAGSATGPWSNVYGIARTLLATGTLLTLLFNAPDSLFRPVGEAAPLTLVFLGRYSFFHLLGGDLLEVGRWVAIAALAVCASGWRPRFTAPVHWYISLSYMIAAQQIDGGDQVTGVLTLLLLPVALLDGRRSHWDPAPDRSLHFLGRLREVAAGSCFTAIRVQVCVIYCVAFVAKLAVAEWTNGTGLYYWFNHPTFGAGELLGGLLQPVLASSLGVTLLTWGVLALEALLAASLVSGKRFRAWMLPAGLAFHFGIIVIHGLFSFFFAMAAALVLYLRPPEEAFSLKGAMESLRRGMSAVRNVWPAAPAEHQPKPVFTPPNEAV